MIKVSVIVPVYKVPLEYLRTCLGSLNAQTMQECEFILVSDGAPEAECSVCEEYSAKDSRFKFFKQEHNGVSATRNYGINQAQGEYITFVDADDWIEPETCKTTYEFAKNNNSDIVFWDLCFEESRKDNDITSFYKQNINVLSHEDFFKFQEYIIHCPKRNFLVPPLTVCKLYKQSCINAKHLTFDTNLSRGEDRVFNYQLTQYANRISYLKKIFYHYVIHPSSTEQSFHRHDFTTLLAFIQRLDNLSNQKKRPCIANETIGCFFRCTSKLNKNHLDIKQTYSELLFLKNQVKREPFHTFIQEANLPNYSLFAKCEIALMKRGFSFIFTLRILKAFLLHSLKLL